MRESRWTSGTQKLSKQYTQSKCGLTYLTYVDRNQVRQLVRLIHSYGVHHHDIAIRNVVVKDKCRFTLIDFGQSVEECSDGGCPEADLEALELE